MTQVDVSFEPHGATAREPLERGGGELAPREDVGAGERAGAGAGAVDSVPVADEASEARRFRRAQWRILLATMFCYLFYYTGRQSFGFAIPGLEQELGIGKTWLGWISTSMLWSYALGQAVNGQLGDRFGGRAMMSLGAWLSCGLNWLVSFGQGPWSIAVPWSANGFAQSMGWAPGSRVLANWWSAEERGRVYGAYVFAAGSASVLTYVTSTLILTWDLNWRWIFRLPVLFLLLGGTVYYFLVRSTPEELGFPSPHEDDSAGEDAAGRDAAGAADQELSEPPAKRGGLREVVGRTLEVLANPRFCIASVAIGFQSMARYGLLIWVPVHFLGTNWKSNPSGAWISVALPIGMALGALASGWMSDRLFHSNRSRPIVLFMGLAALCSVAMYYQAPGSFLSIPLLFLCGFFAYGPQSAFWALCPDLLGTRRAGTGTGVMNTFAYGFAGVGEPLIGWLIESRGNQTGLVFASVAAACVASAVCALFIRR
ncbi:MFS transporter [Planctomyces sp. SH-PL14]|uniref:MFS transporter n=1 Tax=Planctomyces sp. SH-PL14 TaxID=1632864 RepID=UPI00078ECE21|nr:MFS transporter [Planctomyces sp. SH-PL14]AMV20987.1 Glycerol-3-phosphate transporter [Planctomyces sp. SH-PL14]